MNEMNDVLEMSIEGGRSTLNETLEVSRLVYTQKSFNEKYVHNEKPAFNLHEKFDNITDRLRLSDKKKFFKNSLYRWFPPLKWIPKYDIQANLLSDTVSGITIGILQITQGECVF